MRVASESQLLYCAACGDRLTETTRNVLTMVWAPSEPGGRRTAAARWGYCDGCQQQIVNKITDYTTSLKTKRQGSLSGEVGGLKQNW